MEYEPVKDELMNHDTHLNKQISVRIKRFEAETRKQITVCVDQNFKGEF